MKKCTVFLAMFFYLTGIAVYAQSLGDLAREEQKRREGISGETIIVLESARPVAPDEEISTEDDDGETENPRNSDEKEDEKDSDEKAAPDELTDLYGKPESYWRKEMSDARSELKQLEDEMKELTSRRNALQFQYNATSSAPLGPIKDEIDRTIQEQELNRKNLEEARLKLQSLRNEARSSGALPGWIE